MSGPNFNKTDPNFDKTGKVCLWTTKSIIRKPAISFEQIFYFVLCYNEHSSFESIRRIELFYKQYI